MGLTGPNRTFALLIALSVALMAAIGWSTHHLLLAGAPALATSGARPSASCLLLPLADDFGPHFVSYAFLLTIAAGSVSGLRTLSRQYRHTRELLRACLAARLGDRYTLATTVRRLGLEGKLDIVDLPVPIALCHGYFRPRVLISTGLVAALPRCGLEAVLLHEREHLRQRDPLKVAGQAAHLRRLLRPGGRGALPALSRREGACSR